MCIIHVLFHDYYIVYIICAKKWGEKKQRFLIVPNRHFLWETWKVNNNLMFVIFMNEGVWVHINFAFSHIISLTMLQEPVNLLESVAKFVILIKYVTGMMFVYWWNVVWRPLDAQHSYFLFFHIVPSCPNEIPSVLSSYLLLYSWCKYSSSG